MHKHPCGEDITSQRSSELFASISEEAKHEFFKLQGRRRIEDEFRAYNITSVSSCSECLRQVLYGNNKEDDRLPQLNLALVFGETSGLPFYYRKLAGNIPDVKTVKTLPAELDVLGYSKVKLVMDRGFYSEDNLNALFRDHVKFIIAGRMSLSFIQQDLEPLYGQFRSYGRFNDTYELYCHTGRQNGTTGNTGRTKGTPFQSQGASMWCITTTTSTGRPRRRKPSTAG